MIPLARAAARPAVLVVALSSIAAAAAALTLDQLHLVPWTVTVPSLVAVAAVVLLVTRFGIEALGLVLLAGAVVTASWNATSVKGLPPSHLLLAAALLVLAPVAIARNRRIVVPAWVWALGGGIVLVAALSIVAPVSAAYLAGRYTVPLESVLIAKIPTAAVADQLNAVRWLVPAIAFPIAACLAIAPAPGRARRFADLWVLGVVVNAGVGITDQLRLTHISALLLPFVDIGGRQAGLTEQPNHLALSAALVLPIAAWRFTQPGARHPFLVRIAALAAVFVLAGGILVSGSRGGLAIGGVGVVAALLVSAPGRRIVPWLLALGAAGLAIVTALHPALVDQVGTRLRLFGAASAEESDAIRSRIHAQAIADFVHDPWRGVGLHVLSDGHDIYLQLVASGGALLFVAFVLTMLGTARDGVIVARTEDRLAAALLVSIGAWLAVGVVENQIADLYLYIPIGLIAGLRASALLRQPALLPRPSVRPLPALEGPIRGTP